jgi:hypothetical protein
MVMVTREVRWFRHGAVPAHVLAWFSASGAVGAREERLDWYDPDAARAGLGVKDRDELSHDEKRRLTAQPGVELAPGLVGCVEDWVKTSKPIGRSAGRSERCHLPVHKVIITRRYEAEPETGRPWTEAGCEVELASITVGAREAWTLCFETFGPSHRVAEALRVGVDGLLRETPLPDDITFSGDESCGYPEWLSRLSPVSPGGVEV